MLRFTIRDLLWLTIAAAVCAAWWIDRRQIAQLQNKNSELEAMRDTLREAGLEEMVELLTKVRDPAQKQAVKSAYAAIDPSAAPSDWTDDELTRVIRLLNRSQPPAIGR